MSLKFLHMNVSSECYAREIDATLPRILALADRDPLSPTLGMVDRQYWAWKLIDFPNATFQGAAHGLACLVSAGLVSDRLDASRLIERIEEMAIATSAMTRRDGSLEEAFPFERSYCVTALIAYDLLRASEDLADAGMQVSVDIDEVVAPLIKFLVVADETHGLISNHLATAAAALFRWNAKTGDVAARDKATTLINRILENQSEEGWFREYDGADPGYQTLCMTYLTDVADVAPSTRLDAALDASVTFLTNFIHPDHSFAGLYGSRATRVFYPAGIEALGVRLPAASALAAAARRGIAEHATVPLSAIDQPNLLPLFNSYCRALRTRMQQLDDETKPCSGDDKSQHLPAFADQPYRNHFSEAGILVDSGPSHYTVISTHKGGVVAHWRDGKESEFDPGIVATDQRQRHYTSQTFNHENHVELDDAQGVLTIDSTLRELCHPLPDPVKFTVLRLANISIMRIASVGEWVKQILVSLLITAKRKKVGTATRTIKLGPDLLIEDQISSQVKLTTVRPSRTFSVVHMASQGYWQMGDDASSINTGSTTPVDKDGDAR